MRSIAIFLVTIVTSLLFFSCEKEMELPPITQIGANTFGCRINGKAWVPEAGKPADYNDILIYEFEEYRDSGVFQVRASNTKRGGYVALFSNVAGSVGTYPISRTDSTHVTQVILGFGKCQYFSDEDATCVGSITLTRVDYQAGILSGTFSYTISLPDCETIHVTDGRFDLKTN
ncbi:hypothetical protein [Xanthocytophaga flava]|uniref:hypothetical protein n=1 Tax=Xanthocytophaga flava TaxID=3048013 RepID=UPI0028D6551F|nr:hypothetical protein [Xanthocytophaga flavus]MDJ1467129.1 hypothetical protein [Xanthocytophaga flavus]